MKAIKYPVKVKCHFCNSELIKEKQYVNYRLKKGKNFYCNQECFSYEKSPKHFNMMKHINNLNFYYLIGLIVTDGHIDYPSSETKTNVYYCIIKLNKKDEDILYKLFNFFGGKIYYENSGKTVCYRIWNKEFVKFLIDIVGIKNIKDEKMNIDNWFNNLSNEQKNSFILGCFDGDGSLNIGIDKKYKKFTTYLCSSSLNFLKTIQQYIFREFKISGSLKEITPDKHMNFESVKNSKKIMKSNKILYYFFLNGKSAKIICDIYKNCKNFTMNRKKQKALEILQNIKENSIKKRKSKYRGVCYNKLCKKQWNTKIIHENKIIYSTRFKKEYSAALMYDILCIIFKKSLFLNFLNNLDFYKKFIYKNKLDKNSDFKLITEELLLISF